MQRQRERDLACGGCGLPRDVTMRHEDDAPAFVSEAVQCHACRTRAEAAAKFSDRKTEPSDGVFFTIGQDG